MKPRVKEKLGARHHTHQGRAARLAEYGSSSRENSSTFTGIVSFVRKDALDVAREPSLLRAQRVMSSTVYRALRSAGYPDEGIIAFATSLLAELCDEKGAPQSGPRIAKIKFANPGEL